MTKSQSSASPNPLPFVFICIAIIGMIFVTLYGGMTSTQKARKELLGKQLRVYAEVSSRDRVEIGTLSVTQASGNWDLIGYRGHVGGILTTKSDVQIVKIMLETVGTSFVTENVPNWKAIDVEPSEVSVLPAQ